MNSSNPQNFLSKTYSGPDRDYLLSLFPESEMASLASKLGDGMEGRIAAHLRRRFAEGTLVDEQRERESAVVEFLDSPF